METLEFEALMIYGSNSESYGMSSHLVLQFRVNLTEVDRTDVLQILQIYSSSSHEIC